MPGEYGGSPDVFFRGAVSLPRSKTAPSGHALESGAVSRRSLRQRRRLNRDREGVAWLAS